MGPCVKFVLAIINSNSPQKNGGWFFFSQNWTRRGVGGRGPRASCLWTQKLLILIFESFPYFDIFAASVQFFCSHPIFFCNLCCRYCAVCHPYNVLIRSRTRPRWQVSLLKWISPCYLLGGLGISFCSKYHTPPPPVAEIKEIKLFCFF